MKENDQLYGVGILDKIIPIVFLLASIVLLSTQLMPIGLTVLAGLYLEQYKESLFMMLSTSWIFIIWLIVTYIGWKQITLLFRFKKYIKRIGREEIIELIYLADVADESREFVIEDLEKMIKKGWFPQGRIDMVNYSLILKDSMKGE